MMRLIRTLLPAALLLCGAALCQGQARQDPHVGFVYPAGGRQGTVFEIAVRGQRLQSPSEIRISGSGVSAVVVRTEGAGGPLNQAQRNTLGYRIATITAQRADRPPPNPPTTPLQELPDLPDLRELERMTAAQLQAVRVKYVNVANRPRVPLAEVVVVEVTIAADAEPGDRELRVRTPLGLSNPVVFQVGEFRELSEPDGILVTEPQAARPPVTLNGQIMPGQVDRHPLELRGGQELVVAVQARRLIPYISDAVPGWFQAVVSLRDASGRELGYADWYGFDTDPAFRFQVPADGRYVLEIHDALYRGREDFVYRVAIGEERDVAPLFPLGMRGGVPLGSARPDRERQAQLAREHFGTAVAGLPLNSEREPNDTERDASHITLPQLIEGAIQSPGDRDLFRFQARAGQEVVAEVFARRMGSPLDSLLRLFDASGRLIAWNDDHEDRTAGLLTHHADSYLSVRLPAAGAYTLQVSDAQGAGGPEHAYLLRVGPPRPDFALRISPSGLNVPARSTVTATVTVQRRDGWDGEITLAPKAEIPGIVLGGAVISAGRDEVRITVTARRAQQAPPAAVELEGHAVIAGEPVTRPVLPADSRMQAFAYFHLVPAEQLQVTIGRARPASPILNLAAGERLRLPAGGSAAVTFSLPAPAQGARLLLELSEPPPGVSIRKATLAPPGFTLELQADAQHAGYADNLIVTGFIEVDQPPGPDGQPRVQRTALGVLPAIPFEVVPP